MTTDWTRDLYSDSFSRLLDITEGDPDPARRSMEVFNHDADSTAVIGHVVSLDEYTWEYDRIVP